MFIKFTSHNLPYFNLGVLKCISLFLISMINEGMCQNFNSKKHFVIEAGPSVQFILQQQKVNYKLGATATSYLIGGSTMKTTYSYFVNGNYQLHFKKKLFIKTGLNFINRNSDRSFNIDTVKKYQPLEQNAIIHELEINRCLEIPFYFGILCKRINIALGLKHGFLKRQSYTNKRKNGTISKGSAQTSFGIEYIVPSIFINLKLFKSNKFNTIAIFDLRSKYHLDFGLGLGYNFNFKK